ncbi:MAG: GNAT family N-acetyltransferase [Ruminococcaceae bacterium]|nr:GNAT family N-acetyltransferase [Oscillospiraceae bacterium]
MQHKGTQTIETERLILRRFTVEDADAMYNGWASDPEVTKFLMWPTHSDPYVTAMVLNGWVSQYQKDDCYQWAIVPKGNDDKPIGSIAVVEPLEEPICKAHIGYCIGRKWWHMGITSEALKGVMDFLFDDVGVKSIQSRHDPRNPYSGAVMRRCGMKYDGTLRRSDWNNQGVCDAAYYSLLAEER